jgi:hypothetical protein
MDVWYNGWKLIALHMCNFLQSLMLGNSRA